MGSTNYGNQLKTVELNASASDFTFNRRNLGIVPIGIYSGGFLKIVSGNDFKLTEFVAEIQDSAGYYQIRFQTQTYITLTALNTTPYVVLSWVYSPTPGSNFVDVVLTSDLSLYPHGLVVGKCLFSEATLTGFVYYDTSAMAWMRTVPNDPYFRLKLEFDPDLTTRLVWIFPGIVPNVSGGNVTGSLLLGFHSVAIPTGSPLSHILYINRSVAPGIVSVARTTTYSLADATSIIIAELNNVTSSGALDPTCLRDVRTFAR